MSWEHADLTAQERAALVAWRLATGGQMTTQEIAERTGLSMRGARWLMDRLSRVVPIRQNEENRWQAVEILPDDRVL
jgi:hypothetical protein